MQWMMSAQHHEAICAQPRRRAARLASLAAVSAGLVMAVLPATHADAAQSAIPLKTAQRFAVLAGSGITNTGATTLTGDVGSFSTPTETGFTSITLHGVNHAGDAVTQQAKTDLKGAYNVAAGRGPAASVATELGGRTLSPGVYNGATLGITGTLTLDTKGDPNAVFIFQAGSTLITESSSNVIVLNGGTACNVFWQVGSSATLGTNSHLIGSILALTSITATTGATIEGRLLARNGAVTLDHNTITRVDCAASQPTTTTAGATSTTTGGTGGGSGNTTVPGQGTLPGETIEETAGGGPSSGLTSFSATPPTTVARPPLARTGFDSVLPRIGLTAIVGGLVLFGLSGLRRRQIAA